jgi:23S rRNA (cytidine1920-2'-O)/16S rRNA (cytidine1409-2'-O)-methyltransferase
MKERLDNALIQRGLLTTLALARSCIMTGKVRVNGQPALKAGALIKPTDVIDLTPPPTYVSRGGDKLAHALTAFNLAVTDALCLDVGASTGGFTDCLLQAGARHVVALDVGTQQLHWALRQNPCVTSLEQTHIKDFTPTPQWANGFDVIVADVSFISLATVLPLMALHAKPLTGQMITLLKPQFEYTRYLTDKPLNTPEQSTERFNGVVKTAADRQQIVQAFYEDCLTLLPHWQLTAMAESPLKGAKGNVEYLLWWQQQE